MTGYSHAFFITPTCDEEIDGIKPFLSTEDVEYSVFLDEFSVEILVYGDIYNVNRRDFLEYKRRYGDFVISEINDQLQ